MMNGDFEQLRASEEEAQDITEVERRMAAKEESISLEAVIDGYNARHGTHFTLESIVQDDPKDQVDQGLPG